MQKNGEITNYNIESLFYLLIPNGIKKMVIMTLPNWLSFLNGTWRIQFKMTALMQNI